MKFSFLILQSFFNQKLPKPEKLAEILTMHLFPVEDIEKIGKDFLFEIEVLPNRPDCYSHLGIAREIGTLLGYKLKLPNSKVKEEKNIKTKDFIKVEVKTGCIRYTGRVILNPKIEESPDWLKERLRVCGIQPINNIVDITNYVMLELGQPLHAFDLEKIKGKKIVVRKARKGEKILTLDDEKYELDKDVLVIADLKRPIAIAGIKGGKFSGISKNTKILFLESANFEKRAIRKSSRKIDLRTDASLKFEHGLDPNLTEFAVNRASFLISEITGAKVAKGLVDFYPQKVSQKKVKFNPERTNSLLGIEIPTKKQIKILKNLGFEIKERKRKLEVSVPTFRQDVLNEEDLVEEVGRIFGFDKIKPCFPKTILTFPKENLDLFWENFIKDNLKEMGFSETQNYSFLSFELAKKLGFTFKDLIEIKNPVSLEFQFLRPSLICGLLKNIKENQKRFEKIKIFEFGKIFKKEKNKKIERKMVAGAVFGNKFFELKGVLDTLFSRMGISDFWFDFYKPTPEESKRSLWHLKKSSEVKIGEDEIGFLGEISQKVLFELEIEKGVTAFEIDFEKLSKLATEEKEFEKISPYPAILRDISVLVPEQVLVEDVLKKIQESGGEVIEDVDLIDIFEKEQEGQKSLTFRIVFRAKDRVLEPKEVEKIFQKIVKNLEKKPTWQVRK